VTAKSGHNAAGFRKLKKSGFIASCFFTFCDGQLLYYKNRHTVTVTNIITICIERHFFEAISIDNTKNLPLLSTFCHF
jgi:hypothetical protein